RIGLFGGNPQGSGKTGSAKTTNPGVADQSPRLINVADVESISARENDFDFIVKFTQGLFCIPAAMLGDHWKITNDEGKQIKNATVDYISSLDKNNSKWLKEFLDKHGALIVLCTTLSSIMIPRVITSVQIYQEKAKPGARPRLVKTASG